MPYKDASVKKLKHAEYSRDYYVKNGEKVRKRAAELKREKRKEWAKFKSTIKCINCGFSHSAVIDFHHVDRTNHRSVNLLAQQGKYKEAMEEIKKCIPLCANCHRIVHYEEHKEKKKRLKKKKKKSNSNP
jgi:predicted HNH restriction endonuclease